jgi:hypothetical protein
MSVPLTRSKLICESITSRCNLSDFLSWTFVFFLWREKNLSKVVITNELEYIIIDTANIKVTYTLG